jgi:hypothetical protein
MRRDPGYVILGQQSLYFPRTGRRPLSEERPHAFLRRRHGGEHGPREPAEIRKPIHVPRY